MQEDSDDETIDGILLQLEQLRLQEDYLLERIDQLQKKGKNATTPVTPTAKHKAGDRVWINNKVRKPHNWRVVWDTKNITDFTRRATITQVDAEHIRIRTDSGVDTWRAPGNLTRLR